MRTSAWCLVVAVVFAGLTVGQAEAALGPCGDGYVDPGEQCDDGNTLGGDGCSPLCYSELCGDGNTQTALGEECDDGNTISGDGCSALCEVEVQCDDHADCVLQYDDVCWWYSCGGETLGVCDRPIPRMFGDVTGAGFNTPPNGVVNIHDVVCTLEALGVGNMNLCANADIASQSAITCPHGNGAVTLTDILMVLNAYGPTGSPGASYMCDCPMNPY